MRREKDITVNAPSSRSTRWDDFENFPNFMKQRAVKKTGEDTCTGSPARPYHKEGTRR